MTPPTAVEVAGLRLRILVVDDDDATLVAMLALLSSLGHDVVTADRGRDALRALLAGDFALILLDVQMPEMDGIETARLIRSRDRTRGVPIIFLTGASPTDDATFRGYDAGAVDYLYKPIVPFVLMAKVRAFLELAQSRQELQRRADELEALNAELVRERERAERASHIKSAFLSQMSHELRTPLNAIMGFSQLLAGGHAGPLSGEQADMLGKVLASSRHLLQLINDVLDLAKIESGTLQFNPVPTDVQTITDEVCHAMGPLADGRGVSIAVRVGRMPRLMLDPVRLRQVLYNYVSNAIKFTPPGGSVGIRLFADDTDNLRVEVRDTGIGIAASDIERLFTEFVQLDEGLTRMHKGTGLGLALTKRLVEAQGGSVGVRSTLGRGSVFHALLPRLEVVDVPPGSSPVAGPDLRRSPRAQRAREEVGVGGP